MEDALAVDTRPMILIRPLAPLNAAQSSSSPRRVRHPDEAGDGLARVDYEYERNGTANRS